MSSVEIVKDSVVSSANRIEEAATVVDGLEAGTQVEGVATALPGSDSAAKATTLGATWTQEYDAWAQSVREHAEAMRTAAADIEETDVAVAAAYRPGVPV